MSIGDGTAERGAHILGEDGDCLVGGGVGGARVFFSVGQAFGERRHRCLDATERLGAVVRQLRLSGGGTVAQRRDTLLHILKAVGMALVGIGDLAGELVEESLDVVGKIIRGQVFRAGCL
jgi:hypothetical protein